MKSLRRRVTPLVIALLLPACGTDSDQVVFEIQAQSFANSQWSEPVSHTWLWEGQRRVLHHISKEWLKHGAVNEKTTGIFSVDTEGTITEDVPQ